MELHSYAKRRTLNKKWTIEQKRKLVEARIAYDAWFISKPTSVVPWKNILIAANLDDFNVFFVRKQWSNMLVRYKQYKQTRLGDNIESKTIDAELIKRITQEWEFFEPIHKFMTRKTTNLHSYALTHRMDNINGEHQEVEELENTSVDKEQQHHRQTNETFSKVLHNETITINSSKDCVKENIPNNTTIVIQSNISQDDGIHLFSSDTNEDFQVIAETTRIIKGANKRQSIVDEEDENTSCVRNTDHDFYSKRSAVDMVNELTCHEEDDLHEKQSNYFADASEESQSSMVVDLLQISNTINGAAHLNKKTASDCKFRAADIKTEDVTYCECSALKEENQDKEFCYDMPSTSAQSNLQSNRENPRSSSKTRLSERDKYYRHKRRFNRRLEKRFDAILEVMGEIVKAKCPCVNITPLVGTVTSLATSVGKMLSSDSEDENQTYETNNIPKTAQENQ